MPPPLQDCGGLRHDGLKVLVWCLERHSHSVHLDAVTFKISRAHLLLSCSNHILVNTISLQPILPPGSPSGWLLLFQFTPESVPLGKQFPAATPTPLQGKLIFLGDLLTWHGSPGLPLAEIAPILTQGGNVKSTDDKASLRR